MTNRTLLISAAICISASYGAYSEHMAYDPVKEAREDHIVRERISRSVAANAMEEQRRCLENDPSDWCDRDITYRDNLRLARSIDKKYGDAYNIVDHTRNRNFYALVAVISGWVVFSQLRRRRWE